MLALGYFDLYTPCLSIRSMQHLPCFITDRGLDRLDWLSHSPGQGPQSPATGTIISRTITTTGRLVIERGGLWRNESLA
jgi:hypothetical protein